MDSAHKKDLSPKTKIGKKKISEIPAFIGAKKDKDIVLAHIFTTFLAYLGTAKSFSEVRIKVLYIFWYKWKVKHSIERTAIVVYVSKRIPFFCTNFNFWCSFTLGREKKKRERDSLCQLISSKKERERNIFLSLLLICSTSDLEERKETISPCE